MSASQFLQCLLIPFAGLPQLFHFLIGALGIKLRNGVSQRIKFLITAYTGHYIEYFQLGFIEYRSFHNPLNYIQRQI